jgi:transcriptional regulator of acetoin/glycerol metabolism
VERILLVAEYGHITIEHLPREIVNEAVGHSRQRWGKIPEPVSVAAADKTLDRNARKLYVIEQEKEQIIRALDMNGGNVSKAAAELGISRNTIYRKMKNYNIVN